MPIRGPVPMPIDSPVASPGHAVMASACSASSIATLRVLFGDRNLGVNPPSAIGLTIAVALAVSLRRIAALGA